MTTGFESAKTQSPDGETQTTDLAQDIRKPSIQSPDGNASTSEEVLYCANHPEVETLLRCNRCGKPICLRCAQLTDVGYRCKECIRGVQDTYFNAKPSDNVVAFVTAFVVTAVAAPIAGILFRIFPFWFISIIVAFMVAGAAGGTLTQIIRWATDRRRSRQMRYVALAGIISGVAFGIGAASIVLGIPFRALLSLPMAVFTFLSAMTAYQLLR